MSRYLLVLTLAAVLTPGAAAAQSPQPEVEEARGPESPHLGQASLRVIAGTSRAYPQNVWVFGIGGQVELLVGDWFEIGLGVAVLLGEEGEIIPLELILKKAVPVDDGVEVYFGAGPIAAMLHHSAADGPSSLAWLWGAMAAAGVLFRHSPSWGFFVEAAYQMLFEDGPVHDIEGAVGVAWRF